MPIDGISPSTAALRSAMSSLASLPSTGTDGVSGAEGAGGAAFGDKITGALENLDQLHGVADQLAIDASTGTLTDVHEYTIAAAEAEIATQLTVAVRDKAVDAFNEIMRMQI